MSGYLQRLYDATLAPDVMTSAQPAQRSSSPLVMADQRLAPGAYAGPFVLGLPGDSTTDVRAEALPEPGWPWPAESRDDASPIRPLSRASSSETPVPAISSQPHLDLAAPPRDSLRSLEPTSLDPKADEPRVAAPQAHVGHPRPQAVPDVLPSADRTFASSRTPLEAVLPLPQAVRQDSRTSPVRSSTVVPEPSPIDRSLATAAPERPRDITPRASEVRDGGGPMNRQRPMQVGPALLRPAPVALPEWLPPPSAAPRWTDLVPQVRKLVREEVAAAGQSAGTLAAPEGGADTGTRQRITRACTAEAASVIGPLDRPARSTTLYGLRLR